MRLRGELDLTESTAELAARVRALLKQCCQMCAPGQEHACERRTTIRFEAVESPGRLDPIGPLDPRLQARLTQVSGRPLTRTNRVRLLRDGADTFTAMLELIEHAETELLIENYIIRADAVGRAFGEAFKTRARVGVDVRILHDPFGDPLSLLSLHLQFWGSRARMSVYPPHDRRCGSARGATRPCSSRAAAPSCRLGSREGCPLLHISGCPQ